MQVAAGGRRLLAVGPVSFREHALGCCRLSADLVEIFSLSVLFMTMFGTDSRSMRRACLRLIVV